MANIKNKKIPKIRFDKSNVDAPTINRALDNIIDTLNPFVEQVANELNAAAVVVPSVTSSITIHPSGAAQIQGNDFYFQGANGISFSSNGTNTLTISQVTASSGSSGISAITASADNGSPISGSSFQFKGSGGTSTYTIAPDTILIDSFTITSSAPITLTEVTTSVLTPTTIALGHFDVANSGYPYPLTCTDYGKIGTDHPAVQWQGVDYSEAVTGSAKFGSGSLANYGGCILDVHGETNGNEYFANANGTSGDFTLEFWIFPGNIIGYNYGIAALSSYGGTNSFYLGQLSGQFWIGSSAGANLIPVYWDNTYTNQWHAIALCRQGNTLRFYLDGVLQHTVTDLDGGTNTNRLLLGAAPTTVGTVPGYIDECRFSNSALYTGASYTPATSAFQNYVSSSTTTTTQYNIGLANNFLHVQTQTGSLSGSQLNLVGDCNIQTSVSGSNVVISSLAKQLVGGSNITVAPSSSTTIVNPATTFLWHCDGANGATGSVNNGWASASVGYEQQPLLSENTAHAYISTAQSKFGGSSFYFDGTSLAKGLVYPNIAPSMDQMDGTSGDFTIEFWIRPDQTADSIATVRWIMHLNNSAASNYGLVFYTYNTTAGGSSLVVGAVDGVNGGGVQSPVGYMTSNQWYFITVTRSLGQLRLFINGVLLTDLPASNTNIGTANQIQFGQYASVGGNNYKGYIDEIRISNGLCRYTNTFTPPTAPFPDAGGTVTNPCVNVVSLSDTLNVTAITASAGFSGFLYGTASYALAPTVNTSSFVTTSSFNAFTASYNTGSFSGSFIGTASYATNAGTASVLSGFNQNDYLLTSSFNTFSSSYNTGSFSGSFLGTSSYALNGAVGGDLSGSTANAVVIGIQGRSILPDAPADGESLVWSSTYNAWYPYLVSGSGGGGGSGSYLQPSFHQTGTIASSPIDIELPNGATEFPTADLDYITYNVTFKETSGSNWVNDLANVELVQSGSHIHALIYAPALPYAYNFNAVNTNVSSSTQFNPPRYYGSFCDTTTQTASNITTAYPMQLNTTEEANGFSIVSGSQITAQYAGTYNLQFSAQLTKASANDKDVYIWLRKNGNNVARSATKLTLAGSDASVVAAWNFVVDLNPSDYVQLMWNPKDTGIILLYEGTGSSPAIPEIPSVIATIQQV